jgi:copper homeostasis protein
VTFHRAFDVCRDPFQALEQLVDLGIGRVLTSGQEASALEGAELIRELVGRAGDQIVVMPGGGITPRNVGKIVKLSGVSEVHLSCRKTVESGMTFRNSRVFMGGALYPPEYARKIADEAGIRTVLREIGR